MIPVKKIVLSLCLILLGASVLSGCTKDEVLDQYNNIVQSAGSLSLIHISPSISRPASTLRTRKATMFLRTSGRSLRIPMKPLSTSRPLIWCRKSAAMYGVIQTAGAKQLPSQAYSIVPIVAARCMSCLLYTSQTSQTHDAEPASPEMGSRLIFCFPKSIFYTMRSYSHPCVSRWNTA